MLKASRGEIYAAVQDERAYQDGKFGPLESRPRGVGDWLTVIRVEMREAEEAWAKGPEGPECLREILQVMAVCCACLEQHGVRGR